MTPQKKKKSQLTSCQSNAYYVDTFDSSSSHANHALEIAPRRREPPLRLDGCNKRAHARGRPSLAHRRR